MGAVRRPSGDRGRYGPGRVVCVLALWAAAAWASDPAASVVAVEEDVGAGDGPAVYVGACLSRTGPNAAKGRACLLGVVHRLRAVNAAGGVDGHAVRLLFADDQSTPDGAGRAARTLAEDARVVAVIGPQVSGLAQRVRDTVANAGYNLLFVSPTATRDGLVDPAGWFFCALWTDSAQAGAMARHLAVDIGYTHGTVLIDPHSLYSVGLAARFKSAFTTLGGTVREVVLDYTPPATLSLEAFAGVVADAAKNDPRFIYFPGTAVNITRFVRQCGRANVRALLCGGDTWDHQSIMQSGGWRLENSLFTSPFSAGDPDARVVAFTRAMARIGETTVSLDMVMGADTATMLTEAMRAGGPTRAGSRAGWFALKDLPLISGDTSVRENGTVRKDVLVLRVVGTKTGYAPESVKRVSVE